VWESVYSAFPPFLTSENSLTLGRNCITVVSVQKPLSNALIFLFTWKSMLEWRPLNVKNVRKPLDTPHALIFTCELTLERNHMNVRNVGKPLCVLPTFEDMWKLTLGKMYKRCEMWERLQGVFTSQHIWNVVEMRHECKKARKCCVSVWRLENSQLRETCVRTPCGNAFVSGMSLPACKKIHTRSTDQGLTCKVDAGSLIIGFCFLIRIFKVMNFPLIPFQL